MENKARHGCVTAWLILMIIGNSLAIVGYFVADTLSPETSVEVMSRGNKMILGIISVANLSFSILLLKWVKWAFFGFLVTSLLTFLINLNSGIGIEISLTGLSGVLILFAVLQIKADGLSAWEQLK